MVHIRYIKTVEKRKKQNGLGDFHRLLTPRVIGTYFLLTIIKIKLGTTAMRRHKIKSSRQCYLI